MNTTLLEYVLLIAGTGWILFGIHLCCPRRHFIAVAGIGLISFAICILDQYFPGTFPGSSPDSRTFLTIISRTSTNIGTENMAIYFGASQGTALFLKTLYAIKNIFQNSLQPSVSVFFGALNAITALLVLRIAERMSRKRVYVQMSTAAFFIMPSFILFNSFVLREGIQTCLLTLYGYCFVRSSKKCYLIFSFVALVGLTMMHSSLYLLAYALGLYIVIWQIKLIRGGVGRFSIPIIFAGMLIVLILSPYGSLVETFATNATIEDASANYWMPPVMIGTSIGTVFRSASYFFQPVLTSLRPGDILLACERLVLLAMVLICYLGRLESGEDQICLLQVRGLLSIWVMTNVFWSVGTVNWGTAARHMSISYPLLLACYLATNSYKTFGHKSGSEQCES